MLIIRADANLSTVGQPSMMRITTMRKSDIREVDKCPRSIAITTHVPLQKLATENDCLGLAMGKFADVLGHDVPPRGPSGDTSWISR